MKEKIKFDPGFAPLVIDSLQKLGYTYYSFNAISNLKLKKINYLQTSKKLEKYLKNNISFYLGCLMWAEYISQFEDWEREGNKLLGEVCEEKEYTDEINFLIDLIEKEMPRDYKYFLNKNYSLDERYLPILKTYREFLIINKGFCNCSNTSEIKIPQTMKQLSKDELETLNTNIKNAIQEENLSKLLEYYDFVF